MDWSLILTVLLFLLGALGSTALLYLKSQNSDLKDKLLSLDKRIEKMEDLERRQVEDFDGKLRRIENQCDEKLRRIEDTTVSNQVFAMALDNINTNQQRFFSMLKEIGENMALMKTDIDSKFEIIRKSLPIHPS